MKKLMLKGMSVLLVVTVSVALTLFGISEVWAQQKHKSSFKSLAENTQLGCCVLPFLTSM